MTISTARLSAGSSTKRSADDVKFDVMAVPVLECVDDLLNMRPSISRALGHELDVQALTGRLCPVQLDDGTVAILSLAEHVDGDQADALADHVLRHGYRLARPQRYVLPAPLLLAVARGQMQAFSCGQIAIEPAPSSTALSDAFQEMLEWGVRFGASDLHINIHLRDTESEVRFTLSGRYIAPDRFQGIPTRTLLDMLSVIWMDIRGGNGAVFDPFTEQQGNLVRMVDGSPVLLRWASMAAERGPSVCLRLLPRKVRLDMPTLSELGYLPQQCEVIESALATQGGAIIFSGAVGSGKSTSLAALMSTVPTDRKIVTLEDPVEYLIPHAIQNSLVRTLRETAHDEYGAKLRTLKRSAMNDVLLGEIRDRETGRAFLDLAGSGVSVYTTTHAPGAALVGDRLASDFIGVPRDFLATPGVLKLIVHQALLPVLCAHCCLTLDEAARIDGPPSGAGSWSKWLDWLSQLYDADKTSLRMRRLQGCHVCREAGSQDLAGYLGRTVVAEHLEPASDPELLQAIARGESFAYLSKRTPGSRGALPAGSMSSIVHCAMYKALKGLIDVRDVERAFMPLSVQYRMRGPKGRWGVEAVA